MSPGKKVLIIGPGFIGWNVLDILVSEGYSVTGFVRRKEHGEAIKASGAAQVVLGDLDDTKLITEQTIQHDIVFHTATADHLPSVQAVLEGLRRRVDKGLEGVFVHTSGTSVLEDDSMGAYKSDKVYRDDRPEDIDAVADSALHREIDLAIVRAQKELAGTGKVKIVIMIPPTIYGWTHGRGTIQLPYLARFALKHGFVPVIGTGLAVESNIHVLDLARAYVALLHFLESEQPSSPKLSNPYWFCEGTGDNEPSWAEIAAHIAQSMRAAGKAEIEEKPRQLEGEELWADLFGPVTPSIVAINSRSRAVRLRELGWEAREKDWKRSWVEDELPNILKE